MYYYVCIILFMTILFSKPELITATWFVGYDINVNCVARDVEPHHR